MHQLSGIIKNKHVNTLRKRADYLERIVAADMEKTKPFQAKELYAIRAVLLCAVEVPDEPQSSQESVDVVG